LSELEIKKIILRCGTYLGEVIRKNTSTKINWITYEEAVKVISDIEKIVEKDITTHIVLYDIKGKRVWFPLGKVYKLLNFGKGENISSFAKTVLSK
jgi:hypothetical protein